MVNWTDVTTYVSPRRQGADKPIGTVSLHGNNQSGISPKEKVIDSVIVNIQITACRVRGGYWKDVRVVSPVGHNDRCSCLEERQEQQ